VVDPPLPPTYTTPRDVPELEVRLAAIERELEPTPSIQERFRALEVEPPSRGLEL